MALAANRPQLASMCHRADTPSTPSAMYEDLLHRKRLLLRVRGSSQPSGRGAPLPAGLLVPGLAWPCTRSPPLSSQLFAGNTYLGCYDDLQRMEDDGLLKEHLLKHGYTEGMPPTRGVWQHSALCARGRFHLPNGGSQSIRGHLLFFILRFSNIPCSSIGDAPIIVKARAVITVAHQAGQHTVRHGLQNHPRSMGDAVHFAHHFWKPPGHH